MRLLLWVLLSGLLSATLGQEQVEQGPSWGTSTVIRLITQPYHQVQSRRAQQERLDALAELASVGVSPDVTVSSQEEPAHKTTQDILEAVGAVVASLNPGILQNGAGGGGEPVRAGESSDPTPAGEATGGDDAEATGGGDAAEATGGDAAEATGGEDAEASGGAAEDNAASEAGEPSVTTTLATVEAAEATEIPSTTPDDTVHQPEVEDPEVAGNSKRRRAVAKYNTAVDQILTILSPRLIKAEGFPLTVDEETLTALDASDAPSPPPEPEPEQRPGGTGVSKRKKNMNKRKRKNKNNKKKKNKNNQAGEEEEEEGGDNGASQTTLKVTKTKKNRNKNPEEASAAEASEGKKKNKNRNKDRRNKNKKRRNKNKKNKGRTNEEEKEDGAMTMEGEEQTREGKALEEEEGEEREAAQVEEEEEEEEAGAADAGQNLKGKSEKKNKKNKKNKNKREKKEGKKNKKKNRKGGKKNKKNKKNNKKNKKDSKGRSDMPELEEREELEPVLPTQEEVASSNALLVGFTKLTHESDVSVDLSSNHPQFEAKVLVGPLSVQLADRRRALTKSQITATLTTLAKFRVKSVRGRDRIKLLQMDVIHLEPSHVKVTRSDLHLEPQLVAAAQDQVVQAVDVDRIGRIISTEIEAILEADDRLQNLEDHPFLQQ
ncbi:uncharacterized protein [Panulirus ornatus]|uniref:uncharacterized protein isoform X2 n=1 Tax=Panulirus ornatus TaxID=150431 RepID=UPI003A8981C3